MSHHWKINFMEKKSETAQFYKVKTFRPELNNTLFIGRGPYLYAEDRDEQRTKVRVNVHISEHSHNTVILQGVATM